MEAPAVKPLLTEVLQTLNIKQIKDLLQLHNVQFNSKQKKNELNDLVVKENVNVNVLISHLKLDVEELNSKIQKIRDRAKPASKPVKKSKSLVSGSSAVRSKSKTKLKSKSKSKPVLKKKSNSKSKVEVSEDYDVELHPEEVDDYEESDQDS